MKILYITLLISELLFAQITPITYKGNAQIEIGNHYIGIESHHNFPMLQRISFYYPSANSIDLSTDYWKRDSTFCMAAVLTVDGKKEILNDQSLPVKLTPYSADYIKKDSKKTLTVSYRFCKDEPAMIITYNIKNTGSESENISLHTYLSTTIKTSHTYKKINTANVYAGEHSGLITEYDNPETQFAEIFTANAGEVPSGMYNVNPVKSDSGKWWWNLQIPESPILNGKTTNPVSGYIYEKNVAPGEALEVVQIIGSAKKGESKDLIPKLVNDYKQKVMQYETYIADRIKQNNIATADTIINQTTQWAKGILEVNQHYIDGTIQPMPCPAEYNFYFTHDVLLTDLAVVNYDLKRVRENLDFIIRHADKSYVIPHAYYWKDTAFVTELATTDNWNHFWFIITAGTYLKHSNDIQFLDKLYPYLTKSLEQAMQNEKDGLMWAYRPDWWDIGRNYGPRSFMTILAIKSLREYIYISTVLKKNSAALTDYADKADNLRKNLNDKLWSDEQNYLINYFENNIQDNHYYTGSLLAPVFNLIDQERKEKLTESATKYMFDKNIGIYNVYPMDFHKLIDFLKFAGEEAGPPFKYANGGVWPHGNAWYALALMAAGKKDDAFNFIKNITTINGIMNSPNGQPAMYEYRVSNYTDAKEYGKIDKPQFMWAAGWYIYTLYHLLAIDETEWNIKFNPYLNNELTQAELPLYINGKKYNVRITGKGSGIEGIKINGKEINSCIIPETSEDSGDVSITLGESREPMLLSAGSRVLTCSYEPGRMRMKLSAFKGSKNEVIISSPVKPEEIQINDTTINDYTYKDNILKINFTHENDSDLLTIWFNKKP